MTSWTSRRGTLKMIGAGLAAGAFAPWAPAAERGAMIRKTIHSSGESLPAIGMGTWQTFNVGGDRELRLERTEVLRALLAAGGGMVDCSPMYGSSADVLGFALERIGSTDSLVSAEKVWTRDGNATREQLEQQRRRWGVGRFDLVQVHNLRAWQAHLETLRAMKAASELRYVGVTTSHGRRHGELEAVMEREPLDFVQLTYNLTHREAERRLLPLAREKGIAVIANRPYDGGRLIKGLQRRAQVPAWAGDAFGCRNWADFLLKFIVAHPAVTCAIPATTRVEHLRENTQAGRGALPDASTRERMIRHVESL